MSSKRLHPERRLSVDVSAAVHKKLKKEKKLRNLSSIDQVLQGGFVGLDSSPPGDRAKKQASAPADEEENNAGKEKLPQVMRASQLVRNHKALHYYTGLRILSFRWLLKELSEAVRFLSFFLPCSLRGPGETAAFFSGLYVTFISHAVHIVQQKVSSCPWRGKIEQGLPKTARR